MLFFTFLCSFKVRWRTIFSGIFIQFIMGILAIRWGTGRQVFKCIGNLTETFLEYSYVGASIVYGDKLITQDSVFAFKVIPLKYLPIVLWLACTSVGNIVYHTFRV